MTDLFTKQTSSDRPLIDTHVEDGRLFLPFLHRNYCHRCSAMFAVGSMWYWPSDLQGPHCAKCVIDLQYEQEEWVRGMEQYAWLEENGQLDADMREPSAPLYEMPF